VSIKNDGHYFCRAGGNRPDGLNEPVTARMKETEDARCNQPSKTVTPDSNLKDACIHNGA
ncbi:hypothetical protein ACXZBE_25395, partial [Escherichia coli]